MDMAYKNISARRCKSKGGTAGILVKEGYYIRGNRQKPYPVADSLKVVRWSYMDTMLHGQSRCLDCRTIIVTSQWERKNRVIDGTNGISKQRVCILSIVSGAYLIIWWSEKWSVRSGKRSMRLLGGYIVSWKAPVKDRGRGLIRIVIG